MEVRGRGGARAQSAAVFGKHLADLHALRLVKERVVLSQLEQLVAAAPDAAAERALASIVVEAVTQRDETEDVLLAWRRALIGRRLTDDDAGRAAAPSPVRFEEVVGTLVRVKRRAAEVYEAAGRDCPVPALAARLAALAAQDREHALVLEEILAAGRR